MRPPDFPDAALPAYPWSAGGHRQTVLGYWRRRRLRWTLPTQDLVVDGGDGVGLLARATWQPGPTTERPALVMVHGLCGSDTSSYLLSTGLHAYARGWHVVRMNMRGAGDGLALCSGLYNAGLDADVLAVVTAVAALTPRVALLGFSLGANQALLALGRLRDRLPTALRAGAAVSPPVDLAACADRLERWDNRPYQHHFLTALREAYRCRAQKQPELFEPGRERRPRTIREYDDAITAPYGGYAGVDDYYARASSGPWLASIDRPTLVLAAGDDPMIPASSVARFALPASGLVRREITATGGHVGFVGRSAAPGSFSAAPRVLDFLENALKA
jgi:predicted alpha/beta-fold hydrolase